MLYGLQASPSIPTPVRVKPTLCLRLSPRLSGVPPLMQVRYGCSPLQAILMEYCNLGGLHKYIDNRMFFRDRTQLPEAGGGKGAGGSWQGEANLQHGEGLHGLGCSGAGSTE